MPSKKKSSTNSSKRLPDMAAKSTSKAFLSTQNEQSPSVPTHSMASSYFNTVVGPSEPLSHPNDAMEYNHPSANLDFFPQDPEAGPSNMVPTSLPSPAAQQKKAPPKRKPPINGKAGTSEKRITRAKKSKPPSAMVFKPSALARAHLLATSPAVGHYVSQGETSTELEWAAETHIENLLNSNSRNIQPQAEHAFEPNILRRHTLPKSHTTPAALAEQGRHTFPGFHTSPAALAEQGRHTYPGFHTTSAASAEQGRPQEPTIQAPQPRNPLPWFPLDAATPSPALPTLQPQQLPYHPLSPLNRPILHDLPQKITSMYPVPKGLEVSITQPVEDPDNFKRSIVTYRRLGLTFDDIAAKLHLAGAAADIVTAAAVEHVWRQSDEKDFPCWYGDRVQKLRVFERDDPNYL
ncbi:MAG: hypothetical protein Q9226_002628 [Calogaya cf. arnoldii]